MDMSGHKAVWWRRFTIVAITVVGVATIIASGGGSGGGGGSNTPGTLQFLESSLDVTEGMIVNIRVARSGGSSGVVSVDYATGDGTALGGSDYTAANGTLTWADGVSGNQTISISITDDDMVELSESFTVTLRNVSVATLGAISSATVNIIPEPAQKFGGLWDGSWTVDGGAEPENAIAISTDAGEFQFILPGLLIQVSGTAVVNGTQVIGSGLAFVPEGDSFPDNSTVTGFTFEGTITERSKLSGNWVIEAGDSGSFELNYDPLHERDVTTGTLNGSWLSFNLLGDPVGPAFNINDGQVFRQTPVCTSNASVTLADSGFDVFRWEATITTTDQTECPVAGVYAGLAALGDSDEMLGPLNDALLVLLNNDVRGLALLLLREP
jgi:hypothetical protein